MLAECKCKSAGARNVLNLQFPLLSRLIIMPPQMRVLLSGRAATICSRPFNPSCAIGPLCFPSQPRRSITADEKPLPIADDQDPGPNQERLPHVSEEAAAMGKITGEGGPELDQGTPVQEVSVWR